MRFPEEERQESSHRIFSSSAFSTAKGFVHSRDLTTAFLISSFVGVFPALLTQPLTNTAGAVQRLFQLGKWLYRSTRPNRYLAISSVRGLLSMHFLNELV